VGERRGADRRRGMMREMQREARVEFERTQQSDSGGQEHASKADREGIPAGHRLEAAARDRDEATRRQSDAEKLRVPRGDAITGGGGDVTRGPAAPEPAAPEK